MAVTITAAELVPTFPDSFVGDRTAFAERILRFAPAFMLKQAPDAPDEMHNEATIRLAGYLVDRNSLSIASIQNERALSGVVQGQFANSFRYSGAQALLLPWISHGIGIVEEEDAT